MIKILLLAANPQDAYLPYLDKEIRDINQELVHAKFCNHFKFEPQVAVRLKDLRGILERSKPDIVHFSGHATASSEILLVDDQGLSRPVAAETIKQILYGFKDHIRCVVFNTCYSEELANSVAEYTDCVIGILGEVEDKLAPDFAREFYGQLANGQDVATAFIRARIQLDKHSHIARLLTLKVNPSQMIFTDSPAITTIQVICYICGFAFSIYAIGVFSMVMATQIYLILKLDQTSYIYSLVGLASCLGIIWGSFVIKPLLRRINNLLFRSN